ncbi:hypothetical protein V501_01847, partial [Pseudogymnoascus sp. VKM F-4519 (FW-2642)]
TQVAGMIYGRELMEGNSAIVDRREKFRRTGSRVSWLAGACVTGDYKRGQPGFGHYGDRRWEDDVILIARAELERGDDDCGSPIKVVRGEFTQAIQADFRPDMKKASAAMVRRGVQMMYLTATLALVDMPEFIEVIKVQIPADNIFRDSTSRRNIAYSVVEHKGDIEETSSIEAIKELGKELEYPTYYAKVGSEAEKKKIRQQ